MEKCTEKITFHIIFNVKKMMVSEVDDNNNNICFVSNFNADNTEQLFCLKW